MPQFKEGQITNQIGNLAVTNAVQTLDLDGSLTYLEVLSGTVWIDVLGGTAAVDGAACSEISAGGYLSFRNQRLSMISDATGATVQIIQYGDQV